MISGIYNFKKYMKTVFGEKPVHTKVTKRVIRAGLLFPEFRKHFKLELIRFSEK